VAELLVEAEAGHVPRRGRGRPRGLGILPSEVEAVLDGQVSERLVRLARILQVMDVARGGLLPRWCPKCGGPYRYSFSKEETFLRLYCGICHRNTSLNFASVPQSDDNGTCPDCGARLLVDPHRHEVFCPRCWLTVGPVLFDAPYYFS